MVGWWELVVMGTVGILIVSAFALTMVRVMAKREPYKGFMRLRSRRKLTFIGFYSLKKFGGAAHCWDDARIHKRADFDVRKSCDLQALDQVHTHLEGHTSLYIQCL